MPRELRETDDEDERRNDASERQPLEINDLTENSTFDEITRALEANLANEPPTPGEQEEHEAIITRAVEHQSVTSEFEESDEQQETEELINESQEITLESIIMNEQHDSSEVPVEHIHKKVESKYEHQEMEQINDKTSSLSREQNIPENPQIPEDPKTSEIFLNETEDIRIESRLRISETIDSLETLNEKLEQHPDLKEIEDFDEHYRRATIYFHVKALHKQNEPEFIPYKTLEELSQKTGIHTWTLRRWERHDTQPWLLHRIIQREHGKIEQTWHINSFEDFQSLLNRHPHLEERPTFTEQYHRVQQYYKFQTLRQHGHLNDYPSISAIARKLGVPRDSIDLWRQNKSRPELINVVLRLELARIKYETNLHLEAFYHRIPPEQVYNAFKHLCTNKHPTPQDLATALGHLRHSTNLKSPLHFFELTSYHEYGPKWLRNIATAIEQNQKAIEHHLNHQAKPHETTRIGVTNNHVYLWKRDTSPDNWLNLYHHEHFYFSEQQDKDKLIDTAHKHITLHNDQALSRLIGQITDYSEKVYTTDTISDLRKNRIMMEGETLHFILDAIGVNEHNIRPLLSHIGTGNYGSGRLLNPKFPPIEPLRTQLYATMISDGHLTKDRHIDYVEKREGRLTQVRFLLSQFGDLEYKEYTTPSGVKRLSIPAVVGRVLEQWGFPIGDKTILNPELPSYIKFGSKDIKCKYLQEMIPEDGTFVVSKHSKTAKFIVSRSTALHAGLKAEEYGFKQLISEEDKNFLRKFGKLKICFRGTDHQFECYELPWSRLVEFTKSIDSRISKTARHVKFQIEQNPCKLLDGEIQLCRDLGINMRKSTLLIRYYPGSGRVTSEWRAETQKNKDALLWANIALPNDIQKRKKVIEWLETQNR